MLTGFAQQPIEFELTATQHHTDIFNQVEVDVVFTRPGGALWRVPAFWSGDHHFRVRFAAPEPGEYAWHTESTATDDTGLHGCTGSLRAIPYEGSSALYRHGRLRVTDSRRTLEHADGTPFLWLADTWWTGLTTRLDWPAGFRRLAEDRVRKGFNVIQIVAGPLPDFCATMDTWNPQQANEAGWPWETDFARINASFYDLADLRLAFLVEQGLMPCIVGMWGYYLPFMGAQRCRQHWRNLVARYGAYPVTWCLAGECTMPTYERAGQPAGERDSSLQKTGWTEVARYVRQLDPYHNLVTVHPQNSARQSLEDESLLDFDMLQTGHSGYQSLPHSAAAMQAAVTWKPRMPVLNSEVNYEGIMGGSKDEVQRFLFWTSLLQGACGHSYGAQGIWGMNSRSAPYQGTTGSWGEGCWQDVMHYPGSAHVGIGATILRRYLWWRLQPSEEPQAAPSGRDFSFVARLPGELVVAYLPCNCFPAALMGHQSDGGAPLPLRIEPGASYVATFFNPCTGEAIPVGAVTPDHGQWTPPRKPSMADWVLALDARQS